MGDHIHVESTGFTTMIALSEDQQSQVNRWTEQAMETAEKTQLTGDARVALNESIPKIRPILEEFIRAINTTIQNYGDANKGLDNTINKIENEKVG